MYYRIFCVFLGIVVGITTTIIGTHSAAALVINEIMYDLPGGDAHREWIELYNDSTGTVSVATGTSGWRFYDGTSHRIARPLQGSGAISPGAYAILADTASTFLKEHADFVGTVLDTVLSLNNTEGTLRLLDTNGIVLGEVAYAQRQGAGGNGRTLERQADGSFKESSVIGGTPGRENSPPATPAPKPSIKPQPSASLPPQNKKFLKTTPSSFLASASSAKTVAAADNTQGKKTAAHTPGLASDRVTANALTANLAKSTASEYQSFLSRHALWVVLALAAMGAAGLVRWRKSSR